MSVETEVTIMIAILPFLAVWGLLVLSRRVAVAREACVARQIALTDAIHRELGAVAAPEVRRSRSGTWIVSVRLPLEREALVGAIGRITHDLFRRLDRLDRPRLHMVLMPQDARVRPRSTPVGSPQATGRLSRAA